MEHDDIQTTSPDGPFEMVHSTERLPVLRNVGSAERPYGWGALVGMGFGLMVATLGFWSALGVLGWGVVGMGVVLIGRVIKQRNTHDSDRPPR